MILDSRKVSSKILEDVKSNIKDLNKISITPTLSIVRIGNNPGSISYEKSILNRLEPLGIKVNSIVLDDNINEEDLINTINKLNNDPDTHSILLFKPFPESFKEENIIYKIEPTKDVDCLNPTNLGKLMINDKKGFFPCTAEGIVELLDFYKIPIKGKNIVIINNSDIIGKPLAILLSNRFATVTICHEFTKDLKNFTKNADIVITAAGKYGLIKPDMVNKNTILIDAAVTFKTDEDGNRVLDENNQPIRSGDVDETCLKKVKDIISLSPGCGGGTGVITTSLLAKNILKSV